MITNERIIELAAKDFGIIQYSSILPSGNLCIKIFAKMGHLMFNGKFMWKC
jgi:hypothetical protein